MNILSMTYVMIMHAKVMQSSSLATANATSNCTHTHDSTALVLMEHALQDLEA